MQENDRLAALSALKILDTPSEERFDRVTRVAAALLDMPIALVSLIDEERQWCKSCVGAYARELPRSVSFCAHTLDMDGPLVVEDTMLDPRFATNPQVTLAPFLRSYAGVPLTAPGGARVGTLCVAGPRPRTFADWEIERLADLARIVEGELANEELAEALAAQRAGEQRVRAVMAHIGEGIVLFDDEGVIGMANAVAERDFGAPLVGRRIDAMLEGATWADVRARMPDSVDRRRRVRGRRADGSSFPMELVITEADLGGGVRRYIAIGSDVTPREAAERELRASEQRFRAVFDGAAIGIAIIDHHGLVVDANTAMGELFGYPRTLLCGMRAADLSPREEADAEAALIADLFAGRRASYRREKRYVRSDGSELWGSLTASVLAGGDGRPGYVIGMIEDVSERKEVERLKEEFVSVMSHELRTPLTSIRGSLGLLDAGVAGELPAEAHEMVRIALSNAERLGRLVDDTLDLERIEAGRAEIVPVPTRARELLDAAAPVLEPLAAEAGVRLRWEAAAVDVLADQDRIVQALVNLGGNAVKFSPPGGVVAITIEPGGPGEALISVSDQGRGIPVDQLDAIFERFRQVDVSDRREKGGTGLGLPIARSIVEQHRGRIWAESAAGAGATFRFTLPLVARVLDIAVCDRRAATREELLRAVRALGHRAAPFASPEELVVAAGDGHAFRAVLLALGPATAQVIQALDEADATARIPKVVVGAADDGLLGTLERAVPELRRDRVLLVEDDADLGRLLVAGLGRAGLATRLARTGREALNVLEHLEPDLVVLDLGLPGDDGFAVVDRLRAEGRLADVPLLVYSGRALDDADRERLRLGKTEFLTKGSVSPAQVEARIAELLGRVVD